MREFVAQLCGTTPDELETTLLAERRVVVLPDCQVVTDLFLPPDVDPRVAMEVAYDAAFTSPYLLLRKPVVVLLIDKFDQRPYVVLRIKAYVYDHRFEPRLQSDVTMRAKTEFRRRGVLAGWRAGGLAGCRTRRPRPLAAGVSDFRTRRNIHLNRPSRCARAMHRRTACCRPR